MKEEKNHFTENLEKTQMKGGENEILESCLTGNLRRTQMKGGEKEILKGQNYL